LEASGERGTPAAEGVGPSTTAAHWPRSPFPRPRRRRWPLIDVVVGRRQTAAAEGAPRDSRGGRPRTPAVEGAPLGRGSVLPSASAIAACPSPLSGIGRRPLAPPAVEPLRIPRRSATAAAGRRPLAPPVLDSSRRRHRSWNPCAAAAAGPGLLESSRRRRPLFFFFDARSRGVRSWLAGRGSARVRERDD